MIGADQNIAVGYIENLAGAFVEDVLLTGLGQVADVSGVHLAPGDLDGDGDLDVVSGERAGELFTFYMPEPAPSGLFAAGASLLAWLARRRARRN